MSGLEFRDRVSRVRKNPPPDDMGHWMLAVFIGICLMVAVVVMR